MVEVTKQMCEYHVRRCPFCGSPAVLYVGENSYGVTLYRVYCDKVPECGASTGEFLELEQAVSSWNSRKFQLPGWVLRVLDKLT